MNVVNGPATRRRHGFTVSAESLMEEAARREMGARIRELRERSPWKQHHLAEKVGVGLRMWQRTEERGTTDWERVEEIAAIFNADPRWIWDGEERGETPDVLARLNGGGSQLDRIEAALKRIEETQAYFNSVIQAGVAERESSDVVQDRPRASERSSQARASTDR